MSGLMGIHHISALTKSAKENQFFYTEVLGLRLVKNTVNQENTKIRHLFYGNYQGAPGTLLTFFELPRAGHSYLEDNYFSTFSLLIPSGALPFWKQRLKQYRVKLEDTWETLKFSDPDGMPLRMVESPETKTIPHPTRHTAIPVEKQVVGIQGIDIAVEDVEKEGVFLKNWLQMHETETAGEFTNEKRTFTIQLLESASERPTRFGKGAIDHVALSYNHFEELEQMKQRAGQMGLTVEKLVNRGYFSSLYVKDPFGQRFELATLGPGFTVDEPLEKLGTTLALPSFLEPGRTKIEKQLEEN